MGVTITTHAVGVETDGVETTAIQLRVGMTSESGTASLGKKRLSVQTIHHVEDAAFQQSIERDERGWVGKAY